ncbi:MAG: VWA domain-containing protein [Oscillochloridaceae bacterium]|nr:VWA domain-containing protein [Chloroflexaceae bacterium]MDW8389708.1 VWA domain-containing protein [Oscillochloridaceae bacterium]
MPLLPLYPFSALVGQETMKLALLLAVIDPAIGGVLLRGSKGAAKSTAVRALQGLLPETPLLTLPLNATEEMLLGGLDWQAAIQTGDRRFQPGLLARANGGILYVDEVNLLDDHLVDVMLETLSRGWHRVEREGVAAAHAARVTLIGTMNPEEGELRPHLLDRFGLCVEVRAEEDLERRLLVLERREAFDRDPQAFRRQYEEEEERLRARLLAARARVGRIGLPPRLRIFIAELCAQHQVAGHRADLTLQRAARAMAALEDRPEITLADIERVAPLALRHRQREALPPPLAPPPPPPEPAPVPPEHAPPRDTQPSGDATHSDGPATTSDGESAGTTPPAGDQERVFEVGSGFAARRIEARPDRLTRRGSGRRSRTRALRLGRYVRAVPGRGGRDIALDATIRAAAPEQPRRLRPPGMAIAIRAQDLRERQRERRIGNFLLFVVDASGSMGAQARMVAAKGAIMALLADAYQKRDRVALITFRRREAALVLPPTASIELAARQLRALPVGGRTPLAAGLAEAARVLRLHLAKEPAARPILVLITDGKANVALAPGADPRAEALRIAGRLALEPRLTPIVVDTEAPGPVRFGLARDLAEALGAVCYTLDDLRAADLIALVQSR